MITTSMIGSRQPSYNWNRPRTPGSKGITPCICGKSGSNRLSDPISQPVQKFKGSTFGRQRTINKDSTRTCLGPIRGTVLSPDSAVEFDRGREAKPFRNEVDGLVPLS